MRTQSLIFPSLKDAEGDGFPAVALTFDRNPMLAQHELWFAYWQENADALPSNALPGLMARVYRMYPSLVREHHLFLLLEHAGRFDLVLRERKLDSAGVDYLILQDGQAYGVQAYVDTPRSRMFRRKKRSRHKRLGVPIELPLDMDQADAVGPFSVYGKKHLDHIWSVVLADQLQEAA